MSIESEISRDLRPNKQHTFAITN